MTIRTKLLLALLVTLVGFGMVNYELQWFAKKLKNEQAKTYSAAELALNINQTSLLIQQQLSEIVLYVSSRDQHYLDHYRLLQNQTSKQLQQWEMALEKCMAHHDDEHGHEYESGHSDIEGVEQQIKFVEAIRKKMSDMAIEINKVIHLLDKQHAGNEAVLKLFDIRDTIAQPVLYQLAELHKHENKEMDRSVYEVKEYVETVPNAVIYISLVTIAIATALLLWIFRNIICSVYYLVKASRAYAEHDYDFKIETGVGEFSEIYETMKDMAQKIKFTTVDREYWNAVFNSVTDMLFVLDDNNNVVYVNNKVCGILELEAEKFVGKNIEELVTDHLIESKKISAYLDMVRRRQVMDDSNIMLEFFSGTGQAVLTSFTAAVIEQRQSESEYIIAVAHDMREIARLQDQQKQLAEESVKAKEEARLAEFSNQAKTEFLSHMSHELRTPLNAIVGYSDLLMYTLPEDASLSEQKAQIEIINKAGNHLLEIINEVLDLSYVESGGIKFVIESVALQDVLDIAHSIAIPMANKKNVTLHYEINGKHVDQSELKNYPLHVMGDLIRLKQVMVNLISNAIKYNHADGDVAISVDEKADDLVEIAVTDTGPGISAENLETIFKPFERAGAEYSQTEGTGIGLVVTKKLLKLMGSSIQVSSVVGEGTRFSFLLKCK